MDKIFNIRFPEVTPRKYPGGKFTPTRPPGYKVTSQKQLKALKRFAVPEGGVLNPFGKCGNTKRARYRATFFKRTLKPALRPEAMKRNRAKMIAKKQVALEAHELQEIARKNATLAMRTLVEISGNPRAPEATRIAASAVILDRAYGKASQTSITASVTGDKASDINSEELDKRIKRALKRVEELTDRAPKARTGKKRPVDIRKYN